MTIESVIYSQLTGFAGLTALVSTRVYPLPAPQNVTAPFVTYQRISAIRYPGMGSDAGLVSSRFQFDVITTTYSSMRTVMEQLRLSLQRFRSDITTPPVIDTFIENELDLYEDENDLHHGVLDALLHYQE